MNDNYDSFTYNLVQLFQEFSLEVIVFRNDAVSVETVRSRDPDWICISPGPGAPAHAGISKDVIRHLGTEVPILGVCLGMQAINEVFGGKTNPAPVPVHGKTSPIHHKGESIFSGLPSPFLAARYHSLCVEIRSDILVPLAFSPEGVCMAIRHRFLPVLGVQFHPESFMTECGRGLVQNFMSTSTTWHYPAREKTRRVPPCGLAPRHSRKGSRP
jgi:anthranilate synthase component 2